MQESFFHKRRLLYFLWLVWVLLGLLWIGFRPKGEAILSLNAFYNTYSVAFFSFCTRLAEWKGFVFPFLYLMAFKSIRSQLGFLMVALATLLLVYLLKHFVYHDAIRPIVFLEQLNIHLPNRSEIPLNRKHSFPSGHTTAGFAIFFYMALIARKRGFKLLFLFTAMCIGISRIFLAQHFVTDVIAGSVLGVCIASTVYYFWIFKQRNNPKPVDRKLFDGKT